MFTRIKRCNEKLIHFSLLPTEERVIFLSEATLEDRKFFAAVMHRVSGVWKGTAQYRFPHYDSTASFSKHNRREAAASQYWEKSRRVWISIAIFLFVFALCLYLIPASLDDPLVENREVGRTLQSQSHSLPTQLQVSEEATEYLPNKNQHPLKLRPDHFTLFNHSSTFSNFFLCLSG